MKNRGKLVILTMVGVAILAATFSTWYHYRNAHRSLDFWGPNSAVLIAQAPHIELLQLGESVSADEVSEPAATPDEAPSVESKTPDEAAPAAASKSPVAAKAPAESDTAESDAADSQAPPYLEFGGQAWKVLSAKDGRGTQGINNIRRALVQDITFDWETVAPPDEEPDWQYAIEFSDGRYWATVLFDFDSQQIALTGGKKTAILDAAANDDMRIFFLEQFGEPASASDRVQASDPGPGSDKPITDKQAEPAAEAPAGNP